MSTPLRLVGFIFLLFAAARVQSQYTTNHIFAARAEQAFLAAQKEFAAHPENETNGWQLGRVSFDWAEFATNAGQKGVIAQTGINGCRTALAKNPNCAPAHYYLGIDYGKLSEAEAPSLSAYRRIRDIEHEFKTAADLDEKFDFGGPLRCLGLLYRDTPGWPISIGNKRKAREYLERAAAVAPDCPENQLNLAETFIRWRQAAEAEAAWKKLAVIWPAARTNLTGMAWEVNWTDWTTRRTAASADFQKTFKRTLEP